MKRISVILLCAVLSCFASEAQNYMTPWQEGYFEIHAIATGKGEAMFYIFPDGTTMLTDTGDITGNSWDNEPYPDNSKTPGEWVAKYIKDFTGKDRVDYFLLSHYHGDHSGETCAYRPGTHGYSLAGITQVGEEIRFDKIIDRDYPNYNIPTEARIKREPTLNYIKFVEYKTGIGESKGERFAIGSHKQFTMVNNPKGYDFDIWNIAANMEITTGKGKKTRPMYSPDEDITKFDENMFSCVQLMRYGKFTYFHGGDIPGGYWDADHPEPFSREIDEQVADAIGHPVEVIKCSHHGTEDSSSPYFLHKLRPRAVVISSAAAGHPYVGTIERMLDPQMPGCKLLYITCATPEKRMGSELWSKFQGWGHIVVRVYPGGNSYQIFILDATTGDYRIKKVSEMFTL